jgi:hypothetical protein
VTGIRRAPLLACAIVAVSCARACSHGPRKVELARLPAAVEQIAIADDGTAFAYVEKLDGSGRLVYGDAARQPFPVHRMVTFSPVTRKLFYWAGNPPGEGFLFADGAKLGGEFGRESTVGFTPDGAHWATAGVARERPDGSPGPTIELADGRELGRYPDASLPSLSTDGRHVAYLAMGGDGAVKLIVDGAERAAYAVPQGECAERAKRRPKGINPDIWPQFQVRYAADGSLFVMTQDADGWGVYRDGVRLAAYGASVVPPRPNPPANCNAVPVIASWSFTVAEKAPVAAWWERLPGDEDRWRVVANGKPVDEIVCTSAWLRQPPEITADGRHVAYACAEREPEERVFLQADRRRLGPQLDVYAYAWDEDGSHIAYGANDGSPERPWRFYVDGQPETDAFAAVWRPRFVPGSVHLAWESLPNPGGRGILGIGRRRLGSFDEVVWGPTFMRRGTVSWVIRRGRRLIRIDVPTG